MVVRDLTLLTIYRRVSWNSCTCTGVVRSLSWELWLHPCTRSHICCSERDLFHLKTVSTPSWNDSDRFSSFLFPLFLLYVSSRCLLPKFHVLCRGRDAFTWIFQDRTRVTGTLTTCCHPRLRRRVCQVWTSLPLMCILSFFKLVFLPNVLRTFTRQACVGECLPCGVFQTTRLLQGVREILRLRILMVTVYFSFTICLC